MVASVTVPPASNGHADIPIPIPASRTVHVLPPCEDCAHAPICRIRPLFEDLVVDATFADVKLAGLNRSGLVTALALIRSGMTAGAAITLLREKRSPAVLCNPAFERWLRGLEVAA